MPNPKSKSIQILPSYICKTLKVPICTLNFVLQILALIAMEKPVSLSSDDIRDEKVKVLRSLQVVEKNDVIIGQHTAANDIPGYLDDEGVPDDSSTPTFAAMILHIENDRSALATAPEGNMKLHHAQYYIH